MSKKYVAKHLSIFLSLRKNTKRISMTFSGGNHYHQQMEWLVG